MEGELKYTVTFREMGLAAIALLTANVDKKCEFTRYLKHISKLGGWIMVIVTVMGSNVVMKIGSNGSN